KNSYKENQTPLQIGISKAPELNNKISNFKPAILDYSHYDELNIKDHHVGVRPFWKYYIPNDLKMELYKFIPRTNSRVNI
ncbi:MAG: hypothetical protein LBD73_08270, partial [Deferribacteraceae bacterium]|nr:hypothetical protein [Deferribacteraceae bacterium]